MNDSTRPRSPSCRRPGAALFGSLALATATACGGLAMSSDAGEPIASDPIASDPIASDPLPGDEVPNDEAPDELPPLFDILDLKEVYLDAPAEGDPAWGCEFKSRVKVNMYTGRFVNVVCVPDPGGSHYASLSSNIYGTLTAAQRAAIQDAYDQVRASNTEKCTSGAGILTLAVETGRARDRRELLFADDDHAGCPAPRVPSTSFVSGLSELYALLASLL